MNRYTHHHHPPASATKHKMSTTWNTIFDPLADSLYRQRIRNICAFFSCWKLPLRQVFNALPWQLGANAGAPWILVFPRLLKWSMSVTLDTPSGHSNGYTIPKGGKNYFFHTVCGRYEYLAYSYYSGFQQKVHQLISVWNLNHEDAWQHIAIYQQPTHWWSVKLVHFCDVVVKWHPATFKTMNDLDEVQKPNLRATLYKMWFLYPSWARKILILRLIFLLLIYDYFSKTVLSVVKFIVIPTRKPSYHNKLYLFHFMFSFYAHFFKYAEKHSRYKLWNNKSHKLVHKP